MNNQLANLKIKIDFEGNLYVEVPDSENPAAYTIVWLNVVAEPDTIICESIVGKW